MATGRMLAFSEACERNKDPILGILRREFAKCSSVLEIGAGTGQHAVHFATRLPHLVWQPTDRREHLAELAARIAAEGPANLRCPLELDVGREPWPAVEADAAFSANTLHIMSWPEVEAFYRGVGRLLGPGGLLAVYGPFCYAGAFTAESNATFDRSLRQRDPSSGIRDFEAIDALASGAGLRVVADYAMPANNQLLIWRRA